MRYERDQAIDYAAKWAHGRNPLYVNFDALGGDCTNFVSQCLYAGIREMNYTPETGWYYINGYKRTASWTGVEYLYRFLIGNTKAGPSGRVVDASAAMPGDVIQLGRATGVFYHSQLIVEKRGQAFYIAAHSRDQWMTPLSDYRYDQIRFLRILGSTD